MRISSSFLLFFFSFLSTFYSNFVLGQEFHLQPQPQFSLPAPDHTKVTFYPFPFVTVQRDPTNSNDPDYEMISFAFQQICLNDDLSENSCITTPVNDWYYNQNDKCSVQDYSCQSAHWNYTGKSVDGSVFTSITIDAFIMDGSIGKTYDLSSIGTTDIAMIAFKFTINPQTTPSGPLVLYFNVTGMKIPVNQGEPSEGPLPMSGLERVNRYRIGDKEFNGFIYVGENVYDYYAAPLSPPVVAVFENLLTSPQFTITIPTTATYPISYTYTLAIGLQAIANSSWTIQPSIAVVVIFWLLDVFIIGVLVGVCVYSFLQEKKELRAGGGAGGQQRNLGRLIGDGAQL